MKFYLAARWASQEPMRNVRASLVQYGHTVTSRWLDAIRDHDPAPQFFKEHGAKRATDDLEDIDEADALVLDLVGGRGRRAGMMVELGYALAKNKTVYVIGEPDDVFTQLSTVNFATWVSFIEWSGTHVPMSTNARITLCTVHMDGNGCVLEYGHPGVHYFVPPLIMISAKNANFTQVGGDHYRKHGEFQPWDAWWHWNLNPFQASILRYVVRYRDKNGVEDLKKARHTIDKLIELEENKK